MALKVLGLGMGRTGTLSLKLALEKLGFGPCYHMDDLLKRPTDVRYWKTLDKTGQTDWNALFGAYQSAVDFPTIAYHQAILNTFPEVKVILTEREEEAWYESAYQTILNAEPTLLDKVKMSVKLPFSSRLQHLIQVFQLTNKFWVRHAGKDFKRKERALDFYRRWNQQIKQEIPENKLLVYRVTEGWAPLCQFLSVPVPDESFPTSNNRTVFKLKNQQLLRL